MKTDADGDGTIGFLLLEEATEIGFCGGLLVLNTLGRPLEFHCAAPIRPNRGQRILFGESLKPYLLNEIIGPALLAKSASPPHILVVADLAGWSLAGQVAAPLICVELAPQVSGNFSEHREAANPQFPASPLPTSDPFWQPLQLAGQFLRLACQSRDAEQTIQKYLAPLATRLPLVEPFERIRQALAEAHAMAESQAGALAAA